MFDRGPWGSPWLSKFYLAHMGPKMLAMFFLSGSPSCWKLAFLEMAPTRRECQQGVIATYTGDGAQGANFETCVSAQPERRCTNVAYKALLSSLLLVMIRL